MLIYICKMCYLLFVVVFVFVGCGGDDGGVGFVFVFSFVGVLYMGLLFIVVVLLSVLNVDKSVLFVELLDIVVFVNYWLWFCLNEVLNVFDGCVDVEIKVFKLVNNIVIVGYWIKFINGCIMLQLGNIQLIVMLQDKGDFYQLCFVSGLILLGNYLLYMEWLGIINFKLYDDLVNYMGGSCGDDLYLGCLVVEGVFCVDLKGIDGKMSGVILMQGEINLLCQWFFGWDELVFCLIYEVMVEVL